MNAIQNAIEALRLSKEMHIANSGGLPHTFEVIDEAIQALQSLGADSRLIHIGYTNPHQIEYAKDESGLFYPDTEHDCWISVYMLKNHDHRLLHPADSVARGKKVNPLQSLEGEAVGWFTEDHKEDKSATTYDKDVAQRWRSKGWPVTPLYTTPQPPAVPDVYAEMLEHGSPYVIKKSGMYYAHGNKGYVSRVLLAELYTKEYAESHCRVVEECQAIPVTELLTGADEVQEYIDRLLVMKSAMLAAAQQEDKS